MARLGRLSAESGGAVNIRLLRDVLSRNDAETDGQLVERARRGDPKAFEMLVRRYTTAAYAVALARLSVPADAEDVCQDSWLVALRKLDQCRQPEQFAAWFLQIVRNRAVDFRRRRGLRGHLSSSALEALPSSSSADGEFERSELRGRLLRALTAATPLQREVLLLFDLEGWSHREIAGKLGITEGAARVHLHNGRRAVRAILATEDEEGS